MQWHKSPCLRNGVGDLAHVAFYKILSVTLITTCEVFGIRSSQFISHMQNNQIRGINAEILTATQVFLSATCFSHLLLSTPLLISRDVVFQSPGFRMVHSHGTRQKIKRYPVNGFRASLPCINNPARMKGSRVYAVVLFDLASNLKPQTKMQ